MCISVRAEARGFTARSDNAREFLLEARILSEQQGNLTYARATWGMLSWTGFEQGELLYTAEQFRQMQAEARQHEDRDDIARSQLGLAQIAYQWNNLGEAEQGAHEALEIGRQMNVEEFLARATGLLAGLNYSAPFIVAAAVILLNIVWGFFFLPESLSKEQRVSALRLRDLNPLKQLGAMFTLVNRRWLLLAGFFYSFPFAVVQSNLTILIKDSLGWGASGAGIILTIVGVVDILAQGVLVGRLLPIVGEVALGIGSLVLVAISYIMLGAIALIAAPLLLVAGVVLFAGSGGLAENALRGLLSHLAGPSQQGLVGGLLYARLGHATPYCFGALVIVLAIAAVVLAMPVLRASPGAAESETQA